MCSKHQLNFLLYGLKAPFNSCMGPKHWLPTSCMGSKHQLTHSCMGSKLVLKWTTFLPNLLLFIGCPLIYGYSTNSLFPVIIASTRLLRLLDWTPEILYANPSTSLIFWYFHSLYSHCAHTLIWSEVIFLCCAGSLKHFPLWNQVIKRHLILQIIT